MTIWITIAAVAALSFAFKAFGPAVLRDRPIGPRVAAVLDSLAPALLTGLLVVELLGAGWRDADWTPLPGLAGAAALRRFKVPDIVGVLIAVVVTFLVRLSTGR